MTFPVQAPERLSLVPVIAVLLQFSVTELSEAENALKHPVWEPRAPKEVKLQPKILTPRNRSDTASSHGLLSASKPTSPSSSSARSSLAPQTPVR